MAKKSIEDFISQIFKNPIKILYSTFNYPFLDNYTNYETSDLSSLYENREKTFPNECKKDFEFVEKFVLGE